MSSVWVQLYYEGKNEPKNKPKGRCVEIEPIPRNVDALARRLKENDMKNKLSRCDVDEIDIYPPKSSGDENKYKSGKKLSEVIAELKNTSPTSDDHPLIVVAPDPNQADGQKKWFCVTGTIERSVSSAGGRFQLVQLARGGYYRPNEAIEQGFQCRAHPGENKSNLRLVSVGVVFEERAQANQFVAAVHSYVAKTPGVQLHQDQTFQINTMDPFEPQRLVLETDYVRREKDGETPLDSPIWEVETSSMDQSAVTSYYCFDDTVYKYQRIEEPNAFARSIPEGAHIFPAALCRGQYKWLDKQEFNRLALRGPGHQQFDGTGKLNSKRLKTSPMVAVQPINSGTELCQGVRFTKISLRLWCRNANVANAWRPCLHNNVTLCEDGSMPYYEGLSIYCEEGRRQVLLFELQQDPDPTSRPVHVCVTAIPGIDDPTTLSTWNPEDKTVAVSEIMHCLLDWSYTNTTKHIWTTANQVGR